LERTHDLAQGPSWAERQLAIFDDAGDRVEIVRQLTEVSRIE
jgi:hypothetical protein